MGVRFQSKVGLKEREDSFSETCTDIYECPNVLDEFQNFRSDMSVL